LGPKQQRGFCPERLPDNLPARLPIGCGQASQPSASPRGEQAGTWQAGEQARFRV